jgi:hypothetical protein
MADGRVSASPIAVSTFFLFAVNEGMGSGGGASTASERGSKFPKRHLYFSPRGFCSEHSGIDCTWSIRRFSDAEAGAGAAASGADGDGVPSSPPRVGTRQSAHIHTHSPANAPFHSSCSTKPAWGREGETAETEPLGRLTKRFCCFLVTTTGAS